MTRIAIITEGEKREQHIIKSIEKYFFNNHDPVDVVIIPFCTNIYQLYTQLDEDPDLSLIELLRISQSKVLKDLKRTDFSAIYLFFDFDSQSINNMMSSERDIGKIIIKMLTRFNNETEEGLLFISYPMVESLMDCHPQCFNNCMVAENQFTKYKNIVSNRAYGYNQVSKLDYGSWVEIIKYHTQKTNCLLRGEYTIPTYEEFMRFTQELVFDKQYEKYQANNEVLVLSGFHFFILGHFKPDIVYNKIK